MQHERPEHNLSTQLILLKGATVDKYLHIRIDDKLKERAEKLARSKGLKLSHYVRMILTKKIKESTEKP